MGARRAFPLRPMLSTVLLVACASAGGTPASSSPTAAPNQAALEKEFEFLPDRIGGGGWYVVPDGFVNHLNRKRIEPVVLSGGGVYLRSLYRNKGWLFHDHIRVRIGDRVLQTAAVPSYDKSNARQVLESGFISERVSYFGVDAVAIIQAIAEAPAQTPIVVQFVGSEYQHTMDLGAGDRRKFVAAWQLSALLKGKGP